MVNSALSHGAQIPQLGQRDFPTFALACAPKVGGRKVVDIVDLTEGRLVKQLTGQKGIQGIAYAPELDRIFVGNGEGGACNIFDGRDYKLLKSIPLEDADNVRYHAATCKVYVAHADKATTGDAAGT